MPKRPFQRGKIFLPNLIFDVGLGMINEVLKRVKFYRARKADTCHLVNRVSIAISWFVIDVCTDKIVE